MLIACAITLSYFDRQTLPVAIAAIQRDIPISNTRFSDMQAAFLLAYAAMYAGGGRLIDLLGTRTGFLLIMLWWSLACASHGLATGFGMLMASRFLLGIGEGGGFPAATKAISEWFPVAERSLAMGVINSGSALGAVIAPPFIAAVLSFATWRWVFFFPGAFGVLWAVWWWKAYWSPMLHPRLSSTERSELMALLSEKVSPASVSAPSWLQLLGRPEVLGIIGAKFLSDAAWYFYLFWFPKYLYDVRHFDIKQVGYSAWIPYAASGIGCLVSGWFSGWLIKRGHSLNFSRKLALACSAALMPFIVLVTHLPVSLAIVLFSVAFFGHQSWSTLVLVLPADLFPRSVVGSVAGLVGFGGSIGGAILGLIVGYLLDHGFGYGVVFAIVSTLHILALGLILLTVPASRFAVAPQKGIQVR
ncbi:MAG: MFS transporter [Acidobacteriaceae bacterium]|nr:MFS transporter [Acidobacteriaceae bacterium]